MKKLLPNYLLILLLTGITFSAFSQCPNPNRIEEDFSTTSGQTPPTCWTVLPSNNIFLFDNSRATMYGTDRVFILPNTTNTKGVLTFRATHLSNKTYGGLNVLVGVYSGSTFTQLGSASYGTPGWKNFSFDFSANNVNGNIAIKTTSNSSITRLALDDIVYQSQCNVSDSATAVAKNITVKLSAAGTLIINPSEVDNGSFKSCLAPITNLSLDKTLFTCADLGDNTVQLIADDDNGHKDTTTAIVTVEPTIAFISTNMYLDSSGTFVLNEQNVIKASTSTACNDITYTFSDTTFTCSDAGSWIQLTATANYPGGSASLTKNVNVKNYIKPLVKTQDLIVTINDQTGLAEITGSMVDNGSSHGCGIETLTLDKSSFTCSDVGQNTVTLTVTDSSGQSSTGTAIITVESFVSDVNVSSNNNAICFSNGQSDSSNINTDASTIGVSYYLRNDSDSTIVAGPIAGTGNGLTFNTGAINQNKSFHVYAEISDESKALDLSGNNDYLLVNTPGSFNYTNGYTFSAWVKANWTNSSNAFESIFYAGGATGSDIEIYVTNTTSNLTVVHNRSNGASLSYTATANLPTDGKYFHLACTYDGVYFRLYINGAISFTKQLLTPIKSSGSELTFGYLKNTGFPGGQYFNGLLDDIRIYDVARSNSAIIQDMSTCLQGTEDNLVLYFPVQTSTANILMDKVNNVPGQVINGANPFTLSDDNAISCEFTCNNIMSSIIKVGDFEKPTAIAQTITLNLNGGSSVTTTASAINNGSNDNCTASNDLILTIDKSSFTAANLGLNNVLLTVEDLNGNTDTVTAVVNVVSSTGSNSASLNEVRIFPNPSRGIINIIVKNPLEANVKIMDLNGKIIRSFALANNKTNYTTYINDAPGLYFVEIISNGSIKRSKILIK